MSKRPFVFIGSSVEGLKAAKAVQSNLEHSCECQIWHQGLFGLEDGSTLEALVNKLDLFDFAILCLTPDDLTTSRGEEYKSPRDNVVLELGLFLGRLGRERVYIVVNREANAKMPSDLAGVTPASYVDPENGTWESALGTASSAIESAIQRVGPRNRSLSLSMNASVSYRDIGGTLVLRIKNLSPQPIPPYRVELVSEKLMDFVFGSPKNKGELLESQTREHRLVITTTESLDEPIAGLSEAV
jgi:hypothetical protein